MQIEDGVIHQGLTRAYNTLRDHIIGEQKIFILLHAYFSSLLHLPVPQRSSFINGVVLRLFKQ